MAEKTEWDKGLVPFLTVAAAVVGLLVGGVLGKEAIPPGDRMFCIEFDQATGKCVVEHTVEELVEIAREAKR